ncbi:MAG: polysaccharide biosynthesis/export family protein [Steroidobacteraceae bacterium]
MVERPKSYVAFLALLACALCAAPLQQAPAQPVSSDYRLQPGDTIEVSVWKEEDLQRVLIVRPDGKVSMALVGELQAAGRTPDAIRVDVEKRLSTYIPEAVVTVTVQEVGGHRIYVIGQVRKPGSFVMNPRLNVLQALSLAEGTTPFAKLDEIVILRSTGGTQKSLPFKYNRVAGGRDLSENILLESGDVIIVP